MKKLFTILALAPAILMAQDNKIGELLNERAEKMNEAIRLERKAKSAFADPAYTSDEIQALRRKIRELEEEFMKQRDNIEKEIAAKVSELPQVKALTEQAAQLRREADLLRKAAQDLAKGKNKPAPAPAPAPAAKEEAK